MKTITITKEYILFMENKTRGTKAYTNASGDEIVLIDRNNFYKGDTEIFKSELKADLISAAITQGAFSKISFIEKTIEDTKITIISE